jgi:hypothetical protein
MKNILSLFLALTASVFALQAQDVVCKVLATRGQSAVQQGGAEAASAVRTGMQLKSNDKVFLNENSYLGIVTTAGKTLELKEAGIYNVGELVKGIKVDNSTISQKYVAYVFESLRAGTDAHHKNMSITGSVERSAEAIAYDLELPSETRAIPNQNTIYWKFRNEGDESDKVILVVMNLFDEVLAEVNAQGNFVDLDLRNLGLEAEEIYKIQVFSADRKKKSNAVTMKIPNENEVKTIQSSLNELMDDFNPNSALQNMVLATFLENNGLYMSAFTYYKKAISLEPEVEAYQETFSEFLTKMGLSQ